MPQIEQISRREFLRRTLAFSVSMLWPEGFYLDERRISSEFIEPAFLLYSRPVDGLDSRLPPKILATATTETGFNFSNLGDWTFATMNPENVSKEVEWLALKKIAGWVGNSRRVNNLCLECGKVVGRRINSLGEISCSKEGAFGRIQFLPSTWVSVVLGTEETYERTEKDSLINNLKALGIIDKSIVSLRDFNPFIFNHSFIMSMLYMQRCGITADGGINGWNSDNYQARVIAFRQKIIEENFKKTLERKNKLLGFEEW